MPSLCPCWRRPLAKSQKIAGAGAGAGATGRADGWFLHYRTHTPLARPLPNSAARADPQNPHPPGNGALFRAPKIPLWGSKIPPPGTSVCAPTGFRPRVLLLLSIANSRNYRFSGWAQTAWATSRLGCILLQAHPLAHGPAGPPAGAATGGIYGGWGARRPTTPGLLRLFGFSVRSAGGRDSAAPFPGL
jgi:hypothetical protein